MKTLFKYILLAFLGLVVASAMGLIYLRNCEWNPELAAEYAMQNVEKRSVGLCAKYVRKAMIAGGIPLYRGGSAWSYKYILPFLNFKEIPKTEELMVGDIVVFQPIGGRKFGHIAIWDGRQWVSDFKQRSIFVHKDYTQKECEYAIFRREY